MVSAEFNRSLIAKEISQAQFLENHEWLFPKGIPSCLDFDITDKINSIASYFIDKKGDIKMSAATLLESSSILQEAFSYFISWI